MSKLEALSRSLRQGAQNEAGLAGLDEQYAAANKLANTQTARPDRFGRTSGLAVLNDVIGRAQGGNKLRELEPQRAAARQGLAETKFALPLYQAGVDAAKVTQDQQNVGNRASALVQAAALANRNSESAATTQNNRGVTNTATATGVAEDVAAVRADATLAAATAQAQAKEQDRIRAEARYTEEQGQTATAPTEYVDSNGGKVLLSRRQDGKWINGKGEVMGSIEGLSEVPKATITSDGSSYKDKSANARAEKAINNLAAGDRVVGLFNDLSPETKNRVGSLRERLIKIGSGILPKDLTSLVKAEMESDPQVKQYFSALANTSAIERHALFGGALTEYEGKSAEDFISFVVSLTPEEQISRMRNSIAKNKDALKAGDVVHGNGSTNYMNAYRAMDFKHINGLSESSPQEGSVNANRNAVPTYDAAEEATYQAWKLSQQSQGAQ